MRHQLAVAVLAAAQSLGACAAPHTESGPSRALLEERAALTARLVEIQEQHLEFVKAQFANGVAPETDVTAAEVALIDAKLRDSAARALLEMRD